jgi:Spy/CpxP family protein refolding chaperone
MQSREIPSLSDREIADLKLGRGMGFALPAELNGYPGPLHVLEMADALRLTNEQKAQTQQIFDWMKSQAEALGSSLVAAEAQLGAAFRDRKIDKSRLDELVKGAERIRAELRAVHLSGHIEQAAALTDYQRDVYAAARGYITARFARGAQGGGSGSGSGSGSASAGASGTGGMCASGTGGSCCCGGGGCGGATSQAGMSCRPRQTSE